MSKERELLERWVSQFGNLRHDFNLLTETKELLAQPEQNNTQYLLDQVSMLRAENAMLKEKWSTQKREPLSNIDIKEASRNAKDMSFYNGVKWAERQHGIGGGE